MAGLAAEAGTDGIMMGEVGEAELIARNDLESATNYALIEMARMVKQDIHIPLIIISGGICTPEEGSEIAKAGADVIVPEPL